MIDLRAARNDPAGFRAALARKGAAEAFDRLLEADARWRSVLPRVEELRSRQKLSGKPTPEQAEELRRVKEELHALEEELAAAERERDEALQLVPNPPHPDAPDGTSEEEAVELRRVGEPPAIAHPKDHLELGRFEMERAARLSGSRFGYLVGDTALLALALYRYALDRLVEEGFTPMLPPVLVREEAMFGTGFFPTERSNIYAVDGDDLFLTGTSEVALAGLHMGEVLAAEDLPLRYAAFSTNFRREAGAAGRDTRGMFRVHQFNKVEMFVYTRPEESWAEHERLLAIEESIVQGLGLPYRVVDTAAGDLGASAARKYDIEAWFPSQGRYREITSCSNTTDFQARRLGIRYRSAHGLEPVHTLNGTAVTDRAALAVLENYQQEDGSVSVPPVLERFGAPARIEASG
ncbi:MAG TPA: serine--tRNA ligase [Gaiellaceae bacterium]|nr:serine--tRNA ligase [Gaiellaceae bacterium]